ncbi:uncharacterized protein MONBRDRAFT_36740 [Monosiga brevicollis MX1]|uniref:Acyl carrier protein n=1 Tax=Monosiga brevicollis TaxID=81824 RepID=A9UX83_MONBE|nr:uncharacterized protein MONBRDRAFT_36740 [Monosiga brevicollis MX1]EDQ90174.1 predicted protein [Monosiga brevicollis MX1]|eukprot:XP_001744941.1 hypothetical protein [Monosiga brevicollis MX1]
MSALRNILRTSQVALRATRTPMSRTCVVAQQRFYAVSQTDAEAGVLQILKDFGAIENKSAITLDSHFINDLGLDSLDAVEIVMAVEHEFSLEIPDAEAEKILTGRQAAEYVSANAP